MSRFSFTKVAVQIFLMAAQFFLGIAYAQSCPKSINISEKLQEPSDGWIAVEVQSNRYLTGANIIEGVLHRDPGDNAMLRPTVGREGESVWRFPKSVDDSEVWMQCIYEGSNILLSKKIEPNVRQCSAKWTAASASRKKTLEVKCE